MRRVDTTYVSPPTTIVKMGAFFKCGVLVPANHKGIDANVVATTIRLRLKDFEDKLPLAIASVRPNQRVEEVSAAPGAAPAGIPGVAADGPRPPPGAAANDDDDLAVAQIKREHLVLATQRVAAEVHERQASARSHAATASLAEFHLAQAQKHAPLVDSKTVDEAAAAAATRKAAEERAAREAIEADAAAKTAAATVAAAEASRKKAEMEALLVQQALESQRAEERRKDAAAAAEERRKDAEAAEARQNKRKRDEAAAAAEEDRLRERIRELENRIRAAPTQLDAADDTAELVDLYIKVKEDTTRPRARGRATKVWTKAHPKPKPPPPAPPAPPQVEEEEPVIPEPPKIPECGVDIYDDSYVFDDVADQGVYVAAESLLPDSRTYVGFSSHPTQRIRDHATGVGGVEAAHGFRYRRPLLTTTMAETSKDRELAETITRMHTYGYDKVRGAHYASRACDMRAAHEHACHKYDLCFQCAGSGHNCTNIDRTWRCQLPYFNVHAIAEKYWNP